MDGVNQRTAHVPRIAVTLAWLGLIAGGIGLNMARYPLPSPRARDSCQAQLSPRPAEAAAKAGGPDSLPPSLSRPCRPPEAGSRQPAGLTSALTLEPVAEADGHAGTAMPAVPQPGADLGNGVRRLPPVDQPPAAADVARTKE
jgi:hypothetical protein